MEKNSDIFEPFKDLKKPRFFNVVGWSWLAMGILGVLFGLLSLPSIFQVDQVRALLQTQSANSLPELVDFTDKLLDYYGVVTVIQLVLAILLSWISWKFLAGQNWARLALSTYNGLTGLMVIGSFWGSLSLFNNIMNGEGVQETIASIQMQSFPMYVRVFLWGSMVLMVLPVAWMGWYFHSPKVREYCEIKSTVKP